MILQAMLAWCWKRGPGLPPTTEGPNPLNARTADQAVAHRELHLGACGLDVVVERPRMIWPAAGPTPHELGRADNPSPQPAGGEHGDIPGVGAQRGGLAVFGGTAALGAYGSRGVFSRGLGGMPAAMIDSYVAMPVQRLT